LTTKERQPNWKVQTQTRKDYRMPYTSNENAPQARLDAVKLVKKEGWSQVRAASFAGVSQSTVSKWCAKATDLRKPILTESSRPRSSPNALCKETVAAIWKARIASRNRCALVVHDDLKDMGVTVSLSSVQRTLKRLGLTKQRSKWKRIHPSVPRPTASHPGALVQMDTVHFVDWSAGERFYIYTIIDLYSRWAYAEVHDKLSQAMSLKVALRAQQQAPFRFEMFQTDNGPEFQSYFRKVLATRQIALRHSRVRQSNDNAHVERFNRTLQDECVSSYPLRRNVTQTLLDSYLYYYNYQRKHLSLKLAAPMCQLIIPRS
jgi:transposase InsO family protein